MALTAQQQHARRVIAKLGELGGDGNDAQFEGAFSNLAHAYLRESAPTLETYEVGFEVLERSDDGKRAAGITGFMVGEQLLYAPVFWLNGKIKGHELLFMKSSEIFVPLKENWINYLLERKLPMIGERVERNPRRLGIRQPDTLRQTRSPLKYAAADMMTELNMGDETDESPDQWFDQVYNPQQFNPQLQGLTGQMLPQGHAGMDDAALSQHQFAPEHVQQFQQMTGMPMGQTPDMTDVMGAHDAQSQMAPMLDDGQLQPKMAVSYRWHLRAVQRQMERETQKLGELLPEFFRLTGRRGAEEFVKLARVSPKLAQRAYDIHGQRLIDMVRTAANQPAVPGAKQAQAARQLHADLNYQRPAVRMIRQESVAGGLDLALSRDEQAKLAADGYVVQDDRPLEKLSRAYTTQPRLQIFNPTMTGLYDVVLAYGQIAKCLVVRSPTSLHGSDDRVCLIRLDGEAPYYFRQRYRMSDIWAVRVYEQAEFKKFRDGLETANHLDTNVAERVCLLNDCGDVLGPLDVGKLRREGNGQSCYECNYHEELIIDEGASRRFRCGPKKYYAPASARVLPCRESYGDDVRPGNPSDIDRSLYAGMIKMSVSRTGNSVSFHAPNDRVTVPDAKTALWRLMTRHGLSESQSSALLKQAERGATQCWIKYAEPYLTDAGTFAPMYDLQEQYGMHQMRSGDSVPELASESMQAPVDMPRQERSRSDFDNTHYVNDGGESTAQVAEQAAQTGQQHVFDASVLSTMLRNMRDDQLIDRFIPALARAMDAAGRLLYQFYWHQEDFAERYGDKDMPEMEDSLRNIFEGIGDIVLKLKQKTVDPYPEEQNIGVSLTDLAGAS